MPTLGLTVTSNATAPTSAVTTVRTQTLRTTTTIPPNKIPTPTLGQTEPVRRTTHQRRRTTVVDTSSTQAPVAASTTSTITGTRSMFPNVENGSSFQIRCCRTLLFVALSLLVPSLAISATEIKLQCQLKTENVHTSGRTFHTDVERRTEDALVEIIESERILGFIITGARQTISASTGPTPFLKRFENKSTATVWELDNENQTQEVRMSVSVKIDRNTGLLSYSYLSTIFSTGGTIQETGSGYCSKVDTTKKKF